MRADAAATDVGDVFDIDNALCTLVADGGSDLHLKVNRQPMTRVDGELRPIESSAVLKPEDTEAAVRWMLKDPIKLTELAEEFEVDFSYSISGVARYRINAFRQRGTLSLVARAIPHKIRTVSELMLPEVITELSDQERGIILLTGTTGSGKSTTLAAMIDHINVQPLQARRHDRGPDRVPARRQAARSSTSARREWTRCPSSAPSGASLRQDPDVILNGEMRDEETVHTALAAAETGHLVLSTVHSVDAAETVNRIIDFSRRTCTSRSARCSPAP